MQSVPCGNTEKSGSTVAGAILTGARHATSRELLCQEYTLKADRVTYRIRPKEEKHPALLPVGEQDEFRLKKDKMLLRIPESGNKEHEYIVVAMTASPELAATIDRSRHPPKPHGSQLQVDTSAAAPATAAPATPPPTLLSSAQPASAKPAPSVALVQVESVPAGAQIFVDSSAAGRTPAVLDLKPGTHSIQLVMEGYRDWANSITVAAGAPQRVTAHLSQ